MEYIRIVNWDKFQNYKKYHPPWIKVWNDLLIRYEFQNLPDTSKATLLCLWLLNSQLGNGKIPTDGKWLKKNLPIKGEIKLQPLINAEFIEITDVRGISVEHSSTRGETETEAEAEQSKEETEEKFSPPTVSQINEYCKEKNIYVNAEKFINSYGMKGWMVGKNKMKNWKMAVSNAVDWDCNRLKQPLPKPDEREKIRELEARKQKIREEWGYLREKTDEALRDLLKDKKSHVYYLAGFFIKEILQERKG